MPRTFLVSRPLPLGSILFAFVLSGCEDRGRDPFALLVAEETNPTVHFSPPVPSLPGVVRLYGLEESAGPATDIWDASWSLDAQEGREARREAYELAAPLLAEAMGPPVVEATLSSLFEMLESASRLGETLPVELFASLGDAGSLLALALDEQQRGDAEAAVRYGLEAADVLRELTPEFVAQHLVVKAEEALGRNPSDRSYSDEDWTRGSRLVHGARKSLESGDLARAVRRAYYACQILGVDVR